MNTLPLIGLVMVVKNEQAVIGRCLDSVRELIDTWTICDTGSSDATKGAIREKLDGIPGTIRNHRWRGYGQNGTLAFRSARGRAQWLLRLDADFTVEFHEGLRDWLASDPDPSVDAWMVEIDDHGVRWRLPLLVRGDQTWRYRGAVHEYLDLTGRVDRALTGITVHHHGDGSHQDGKLERWLEVLRPGFDRGDPRDTFYTAETLRFLGRHGEAAAVYDLRANMGGWDEEAWYSAYQAAKLQKDIGGLIAAWATRPWRHEPLTSAASIVASGGSGNDVLFLEHASV